ncbi:MAG: THUMP domain-containing protein [Candidatus Aenigmatarchaeota archaeon]
MLIATCNKGLEEIACKEVNELIKTKAKKLFEGSIIFEGKEEDIITLNLLSKTLHKIYYVLLIDEITELNDIYKKVYEIDWTKYIYQTQTFAIKAERFGKHNFTSLDIAKVAGQAVIDRYLKEKNVRLKVNLDNPNIRIKVIVRNKLLIVALDTTGSSLHKRWYFKYTPTLKPSISASMVLISEAKENIIDPFCGLGTIPIEAYHFIMKIPNLNRNFEFQKFYFLDKSKMFEILEKKIEQKDLKIFGSDIKSHLIQKAKENLENSFAKVNFFVKDALEIDYSQFDYIITDMPFGYKSKAENLEELYKKFLEKTKEVKRAVILTAYPLELEHKYEIDYGTLKAKIYVLDNK